MKINLLFRPPLRRWQARLATALAAAGHQVRCVPGAAEGFGLRGFYAALALERRLSRASSSYFDAAPVPAAGWLDNSPADLVIALDGQRSSQGKVIEPMFGDGRGDGALLDALAQGPPIAVQVCATIDGRAFDVVRASLAIEHPNTLSLALGQILARLVSLLLQAVRRFEGDEFGVEGCPVRADIKRSLSAYRAMGRGLARKIAGRLPGGRRGRDHWRIAFREVSGPAFRVARAWLPPAFTLLPDDGCRFYADPMLFQHEGRRYLFFEDFPYATGKGVISMVEIERDGRVSPPRTVLEPPFHLSYPLVMRHADGIYMLPEMGDARRVQLFRADPFPYHWVADRILLENVIAADATPIEHQGTWWLFATLSNDGGSTWDQLCLFSAPDLFGPWTPHRDNPVLVDAGAARPAGAMWHENGTLMRVAQDCRSRYGDGLAICRVDRLDHDAYEQTVVARLGAPADASGQGVHTFNCAGDLEAIDLRFPPVR